MKRALAAVLVAACACSRGSVVSPRRSPASLRASPTSAATARPIVAPYAVVTNQTGTSVRIVPLHTERGHWLDVGMATVGAVSDGSLAAITAPDAGALVLVSGWPARARTVRGLHRPHDAAFTTDGLVAVTEEASNSLAFVDPRAGRIVKRITLPVRPHNVRTVSASDLIVTMPNGRSFAHVDPSTGSVRTVSVGERPHSCVPVTDGIWCVTYDAPHLLFVADDRVTKRVSIGVYPHHLLPRPDGGVLVSDPQGGRVFRVGPDGTVLGSTSVTRAEQAVEWHGRDYVSSDAGGVSVIDASGSVTRWTVGGAPNAVVIVDR